MSKILKIFASIIVFIVIMIAVVPFIIDPNDFREDIASAASNATGRRLTIEGDLQLSVFPWLGISTGSLSLGNREGFGDKPFATIQSAQVRVKLLPLLKSELEMDTLVLSGLSLNLHRKANGTDNWSDLAGQQQAEATTANTKSGLAGLSLGGVKIEQASIRFQDDSNGQLARLEQLRLETGALVAGKPMAITLATRLDTTQPATNGTLELQTRLLADISTGQFNLEGSQLAINLLGKDLPGGQLKAMLGADMRLDLTAQTLAMSKLVFDSSPLRASGRLALSALDSGNPAIDGELAITPFSPRELFARLNITAPQTADQSVLKQASFNTRVRGSLRHMRLNELKLKLDDTSVNGKIEIVNAARMSLNYDIELDTINLDRYLPPSGTPQSSGFNVINTAHAQPANQELFPVDLLRSFDMRGKVSAQKITMNRLDIANLSAAISQRDGLLKLDPVNGTAYGGTYSGHIQIDGRLQHGNSALVSVDESLKGINIGPVVKALTDKEPVKGQGNVSAKLSSRGQSVNELKRNLDGIIDIALKDGAINGIDITQVIRDTYAKYKGQQASGTGEGKTPFTAMTVTFNVNKGVMQSDNLRIESALPLLRGAGTIDLNNETIDYLLKTSIDETLVNLVSLDKSLVGLPLQVKLYGKLASVDYAIDWFKLIGRALEKSQKDKLLNKLLGREPETKTDKPAATTTEPAREETREERKRRERKEKEDKIKGLLKGLF